MSDTATIASPPIHDDPRIGGEAPLAPAPTQRKRRAYDVWERDPLGLWEPVAEGVEAPSRTAARKQVTGGRAGTFATVLVGEFVEETVDDPQGVLVQSVAHEVTELFGESALLSAGVTAAQIEAVVRAAAAGAQTDG